MRFKPVRVGEVRASHNHVRGLFLRATNRAESAVFAPANRFDSNGFCTAPLFPLTHKPGQHRQSAPNSETLTGKKPARLTPLFRLAEKLLANAPVAKRMANRNSRETQPQIDSERERQSKEAPYTS
jgi:hypothetical protein